MVPKPAKVLLVEDDPVNRRRLTHWLAPLGCDISQAENGDMALAAVRRECPNILIIDGKIPGLAGMDICRRIRQDNLPHYVYTILMATPECENAIPMGLAAGADDVLYKPLRKELFAARMQTGHRILERERQLMQRAMTDALTGIPNRFCFYEHFDRELQRARRHNLELSCILVDVDHFKRINDMYGHTVGDSVLRAVAWVLNTSCRSSDYLCRFGGEEFCLLLTNTGADGAAVWAERARASIAALNIAADANEIFRMTASFGVASRGADSTHPEDLVELADQALLDAKRSGRNRVQTVTPMQPCPVNERRHGLVELFDDRCARDLMISPIVCLHESDTVERAADLILRMRISSLPVVDDDGMLVGVLSEKDLVRMHPTPERWAETASSHMTANVVAYEEDAPAHTIYEFLRRLTIRRVIVTKDGRPTGVISRGSILRYVGNWGEMRAAQGSKWHDSTQRRQLLRSRAAISVTVAALARRTDHLRDAAVQDDESFIASVVDNVSKMQELLVDLLANTQVHYQFSPPDEPK